MFQKSLFRVSTETSVALKLLWFSFPPGKLQNNTLKGHDSFLPHLYNSLSTDIELFHATLPGLTKALSYKLLLKIEPLFSSNIYFTSHVAVTKSDFFIFKCIKVKFCLCLVKHSAMKACGGWRYSSKRY